MPIVVLHGTVLVRNVRPLPPLALGTHQCHFSVEQGSLRAKNWLSCVKKTPAAFTLYLQGRIAQPCTDRGLMERKMIVKNLGFATPLVGTDAEAQESVKVHGLYHEESVGTN